MHRWYEPQTGRYTSADPVAWYTHDPMLYAYAKGSPLRFTDAFGLMPVDCEDCLPILVAKRNAQQRLHLLRTSGSDMDPSPRASNRVAAVTYCIGYSPTQGDAWTERPFGKFPEQPCEFLCTGVHERLHRKMCGRLGTVYNMMSIPDKEIPAYEEELKCLNAALMNGQLELGIGGVSY